MKEKVEEILKPNRQKIFLALFLFLGVSGVIELVVSRSPEVFLGLSGAFGFPLSIFETEMVDCAGMIDCARVESKLSLKGISGDLVFWYGTTALAYEGLERWKR